MERVSCLMVTKDRLDCFRRSFSDYCRQDYPEKELVIVSDGSADYIRALRDAATGRSDVRLVALDRRHVLGALRNISVECASGTLVCQWDDDDRYHPSRLSEQVRRLTDAQADACYLIEQLQLFEDTGELYWCDWSRWSRWRRGPFYRLLPDRAWQWRTPPANFVIPGTLLVYKHLQPRYDDDRASYEDAIVRNHLYRRGRRVVGLWGKGELSIYTFHGRNTYGRDHHLMFARECGLPEARLRPLLPRLKRALATYEFPGEVKLCTGSRQPLDLYHSAAFGAAQPSPSATS